MHKHIFVSFAAATVTHYAYKPTIMICLQIVFVSNGVIATKARIYAWAYLR